MSRRAGRTDQRARRGGLKADAVVLRSVSSPRSTAALAAPRHGMTKDGSECGAGQPTPPASGACQTYLSGAGTGNEALSSARREGRVPLAAPLELWGRRRSLFRIPYVRSAASEEDGSQKPRSSDRSLNLNPAIVLDGRFSRGTSLARSRSSHRVRRPCFHPAPMVNRKERGKIGPLVAQTHPSTSAAQFVRGATSLPSRSALLDRWPPRGAPKRMLRRRRRLVFCLVRGFPSLPGGDPCLVGTNEGLACMSRGGSPETVALLILWHPMPQVARSGIASGARRARVGSDSAGPKSPHGIAGKPPAGRAFGLPTWASAFGAFGVEKRRLLPST
jgi:hypothetical protein